MEKVAFKMGTEGYMEASHRYFREMVPSIKSDKGERADLFKVAGDFLVVEDGGTDNPLLWILEPPGAAVPK